MELIVSVTVLTPLLVAAAFLYRRLNGPTTLPVTAGWIDQLSVDRYLPMKRLLALEDLRFLRSQPGFNRAMATEFRLQRCRIFQSYLDCLKTDFRQVCMALKIIMVQSRYDRPDLAKLLIDSQRAFAVGMLVVYGRLVLYRWGLGSVEVGELLRLFDVARLELRSLVPAQLDMAA